MQSEAILGNQTHLLNSQLIYSCENETETDDNKNIVTCLYSGKWSKPPQCKPKANPKSKSLNPLIVTIPVLGVPFVLITIMYCLFKCKTNRKNIPLFRNKIFDAFVSYCYEETDAQFAIKNNAIKNSNSAIIVMSQDYVDSLWCKEEFEQCYMEHMKDPAFKLFVIMMQPADSLENTSLYMDNFFVQKTYLE